MPKTTYSILTDDAEGDSISVATGLNRQTLVNFLKKTPQLLSTYTIQEWEGDDFLLSTCNGETWMEIDQFESRKLQ